LFVLSHLSSSSIFQEAFFYLGPLSSLPSPTGVNKMALKPFHKASSEHGKGPVRAGAPPAAAIFGEQKIRAFPIFPGMVASTGGFMFGYVR